MFSSLVVLSLCFAVTLADFRDQIPNGNNVPNWFGVGYIMPEGEGPLDRFGLDFVANNQSWKRVCSLDSDGDGLINGAELGDPECIWELGKAPQRTTDITNPGIPDNPNQPTFCNSANVDPNAFDVSLVMPNITVPTSTSYLCYIVAFNDTTAYPQLTGSQRHYAIKFAPIIDNPAMVQHMILHECYGPASIANNNTCPDSGTCDTVAFAWGPGQTEFCLPAFVGVPLQTHYMLKVYYKNPSMLTGQRDNSGITMTLTTKNISVEAGTLATGRVEPRSLFLTPGLMNVTATGTCPRVCTQRLLSSPSTPHGINVFSHLLLTHSHGRRAWTERQRNGSSLILAEDLSPSNQMYHFDPNAPFGKIDQQDKLFTVCEYDTSRESSPVGGEVCFSYLMHYPRLPISYCGSWVVDRYRDGRETAFCGSLYDVKTEQALPTCNMTELTQWIDYAISTILPKCQKNDVDLCNTECDAILKHWLEHACVEAFGVRFMFDFVCTNSTCDAVEMLLDRNCHGVCAYNLESEHCPEIKEGSNVMRYDCIDHTCVPVYITAPVASNNNTNSVHFHQLYGSSFYAMMAVVVIVGVSIAGFAVGFFIWKTVQNRELNYNADINS